MTLYTLSLYTLTLYTLTLYTLTLYTLTLYTLTFSYTPHRRIRYPRTNISIICNFTFISYFQDGSESKTMIANTGRHCQKSEGFGRCH
jgi:hypothetical protein